MATISPYKVASRKTFNVWLSYRKNGNAKYVTFMHLPHSKSGMIIDAFSYMSNSSPNGLDLQKRGNLCLRSYDKEPIRRLGSTHLHYIKQVIEGAKFSEDHDPDTGMVFCGNNNVSPSIAKEQGFRKILPSDLCPFCKNKTDRNCKCDTCAHVSWSTCSKCIAFGLSDIRAPRRMSTVKTKDGNKIMCFPHCVRKNAYKCRGCSMWHDKSLLHKMIRQNHNTTSSLCMNCHEHNGSTVCSSCHAVTRVSDYRKVVTGHLCEHCFERGSSFREKIKPKSKFRIVKATKTCPRTFGIELEINNIHKAEWLAKSIAKMNVRGVEFSVKMDGSVHRGFEIISYPADIRTLSASIKELCPLVKKFRHDYTGCGLHIHVQDKKIDIPSLFKTWCALEPFTFSILPEFRKHCDYCQMINRAGYDWASILKCRDEEDCRNVQGDSCGRYASLNLEALDKYETVEIRCHHSTANYNEIYHWLVYLNKIWEFAREKPDEKTLENLHSASLRKGSENLLFRMLDLPLLTKRHMEKRYEFYKEHPMEEEDDQPGNARGFDSSMRLSNRLLAGYRPTRLVRIQNNGANQIRITPFGNRYELERNDLVDRNSLQF